MMAQISWQRFGTVVEAIAKISPRSSGIPPASFVAACAADNTGGISSAGVPKSSDKRSASKAFGPDNCGRSLPRCPSSASASFTSGAASEVLPKILLTRRLAMAPLLRAFRYGFVEKLSDPFGGDAGRLPLIAEYGGDPPGWPRRLAHVFDDFRARGLQGFRVWIGRGHGTPAVT